MRAAERRLLVRARARRPRRVHHRRRRRAGSTSAPTARARASSRCGTASRWLALSLLLVVFSLQEARRRSRSIGPARGARSAPGRRWRCRVALRSSSLGFVVGFALLTFFIVAVMYRRPLWVAAIVGRRGAAGFYLVFALALGVKLRSSVDVLSGLMQGFAVALQPMNLLWCFVGVLARHRDRHPARASGRRRRSRCCCRSPSR